MKNISKLSIVTILLVSSLTIMVGSVIAPALPSIVENLDFKFTPGLLVTLPSLGVVIFSPIIGRLINKLGSFQLLCWGLIPYAVLGFIGFYLKNNYLLIVDRLLLGAACVAIQVAITTFIAQLFEGKERMKMIAWQGMAIELGGVLFLSIGGFLGELNWTFPFYIYLLAIPFLIMVLLSLPKANITQNKSTYTNDDSDKKRFEKTIIKPVFMGSFFSMAIFFVAYVTLPAYLPKQFSFTESSTGYFMSAISLVAVLTASQMPNITQKLGEKITVCIGFLFFALGYLLFGVTLNIYIMYVGVVLTGIGFGLTIPLLNHLVVEYSGEMSRGKNLGRFSMMVFAGQFAATFVEYIPGNSFYIFICTAFISLLVAIFLYIFFKRNN